MKQLILFFSLLLIAFVAFTQNKIQEKDIIGNWELKAIKMSGVYYEFSKDSIAIYDSLQANDIPHNSEIELKSLLRIAASGFGEGNLSIEKNGLFQINVATISENGVYKIETEKGISFIAFIIESKDLMKGYLDKGVLTLSFQKAGDNELECLFKKKE